MDDGAGAMNSSETYREPKASGQTGDEIDSVRIARILHVISIPVGLLIGGAGCVALWREPVVRAANNGLMTILESGAWLIAASGFFLAVVGAVGLAAMRRLSSQR